MACVESGDAIGNPEVYALVLLGAFAASFVFLVGSATAVAPTVAAVATQHSLLMWARATTGRALHSFAFPLNLSSSVHRKTQLDL